MERESAVYFVTRAAEGQSGIVHEGGSDTTKHQPQPPSTHVDNTTTYTRSRIHCLAADLHVMNRQ